MLVSMTGYGAAQSEFKTMTVQVELRAINNRHLKLSMRTSDGYSAIEPKVESLIRKTIHRGSLYVSIRVLPLNRPFQARINRMALEGYRDQLSEISHETGQEIAIDYNTLLRLPGVVEDVATSQPSDEQVEQEWEMISQVIAQAVDRLQAMRAEEGRSMEVDMTSNLEQLAQRIDDVEQRSPGVVADFRQRLTDRVSKVLEEHDVQLEASDIIREIAIYTDRCDISEEIVRFKSHLNQFHSIIKNEQTAGRKLDFLVQEMNREVNTIGSKANDVVIAQTVVEMKSAIERLREMIQNVE